MRARTVTQLVGMDELGDRSPDDARRVAGAEQAHAGRVHEEHAAGLDDEDGVGRQIDQAAVPVLAVPQRVVAASPSIAPMFRHDPKILHPGQAPRTMYTPGLVDARAPEASHDAIRSCRSLCLALTFASGRPGRRRGRPTPSTSATWSPSTGSPSPRSRRTAARSCSRVSSARPRRQQAPLRSVAYEHRRDRPPEADRITTPPTRARCSRRTARRSTSSRRAAARRRCGSSRSTASEPQPITTLPLDVGSFVALPDGTKLALSMEVFPARPSRRRKSGSTTEAAQKSTGKIYDSLFMRHWDAWADGRRSHLFVMRGRRRRAAST